jgi:hypothetical protein
MSTRPLPLIRHAEIWLVIPIVNVIKVDITEVKIDLDLELILIETHP